MPSALDAPSRCRIPSRVRAPASRASKSASPSCRRSESRSGDGPFAIAMATLLPREAPKPADAAVYSPRKAPAARNSMSKVHPELVAKLEAIGERLLGAVDPHGHLVQLVDLDAFAVRGT